MVLLWGAVSGLFSASGATSDAKNKREADFEVDADPRKLRELRQRTRRVLQEWRLSGFDVDVAVLAAHELTVNALMHTKGPAVLRLILLNGRLRIEVSDADAHKPVPAEAESGGLERGSGLNIITNFADTWGLQPARGGKSVWCELLV